MAKVSRDPIVFRKGTTIGFADAESDDEFLRNCFVDTGNIPLLLDTTSPKSIILGRTGTGKTALLTQIASVQPNCIEISPETLSLHYLTNSTIIQFFEEIGVRLDMFYNLLWRHVLTVELLKNKYMNDERRKNEFLEHLKTVFGRDQARQRALQYLEKWGDHFWETTEYRVKEFTQKLEHELSGSASLQAPSLSLGAEGARRLTQDQRLEISERARRVVDDVQIRDLHEVIKILAEDIFVDPQQKFYIIIDRLDEDWVEDKIRYKLIKALIECVRTFRRIRTVKIIVALRTDLYRRVLSATKDAGFQEEKYESFYIHLAWSQNEIKTMLDKRVNFLFKRQYTKDDVTLSDILPPNQIQKRTSIDYILDRTFNRPREAIIFVNECIHSAENRSRISVANIRQAEVGYSQKRLVSLYDEWRANFPLLPLYARLLKGRPVRFFLHEIDDEEVDKLVVSLLEGHESDDPIYVRAHMHFFDNTISLSGLKLDIARIWYQTGLVGMKAESHLGAQWGFRDRLESGDASIEVTTPLVIHPTFWVGLGVRYEGTEASVTSAVRQRRRSRR